MDNNEADKETFDQQAISLDQKEHNPECDGEGWLNCYSTNVATPCPDCPDSVREKSIEELLKKEPQAEGVPFDAAPTICHEVEELIQERVEIVKVLGSRYKAHIFKHPLFAKEAGPDDIEIACGCGWRIYKGDASVLPKVVQRTFSSVVQTDFWVKVLMLTHRISHRLFLHRHSSLASWNF